MIKFILLLILCTCTCREQFYSRIVTLADDQLNPTNTLQNVLDPHLNKAVSNGFYTRDQANALTQEVLQYNREQYGIDFEAGYYNPSLGSYHLPIASLYPYGTGYTSRNYFVTGDTKYPSRDNPTRPRIILGVGYIAILNQTGVFTSGRSSGYNYIKNDFLTTVQYLIVNNATYTSEEIIKVYGTVPTFQHLNAFNYVEQYVTCDAIDSNGKKGVYIGSTQVLDVPSGKLQVVRALITWD